MKKTKRTQLTALMFAAAAAGLSATGCAQDAAPQEPARTGVETVTATIAPANSALTANTAALTRASDLAGDADGNGKLDAKDIKRLQKYLHGGKKPSGNADINGDGEVDVFDLAALKRAVANPEDFPATETTEPTVETTTTMPITTPLYGPPWMFTDPIEEEESTDPTEDIPQPVYGPPPEWFETTDPTEESSQTEWEETTETTVESLAPITEPQDVYGPPEWFDTTEPTYDTPEPTFQTVYGPPPVSDQ